MRGVTVGERDEGEGSEHTGGTRRRDGLRLSVMLKITPAEPLRFHARALTALNGASSLLEGLARQRHTHTLGFLCFMSHFITDSNFNHQNKKTNPKSYFGSLT